MVAHAFATVPFYRELRKKKGLSASDFRTADDLQKLPLIGSDELSDDPARFLSTTLNQTSALTMDTSGSTGRYKVIHHDVRAMFLARAGGHRARKVLSHFTGQSLGYREIKVTRQGGTGPVVLDFYKAHSWVPNSLGLHRVMVHPEQSFEENVQLINEHKPNVISGFGSYIGALYRWAWMHDRAIHRPQVISYGGDTLRDPDRRVIENKYGIPVVSRYQACEALNIAYQCEARHGFHIYMDQVALRILDSTGETLAPGRSGEIVISNLINRGTVLLNYRIGDLGELNADSCACGRTLPVLSKLHGRTDDLLVLADGERVHESVVLSRLYSVTGVMQVQVIQNTLDDFLIKVVATPEIDFETLRKQLEHALIDIMKATEDVTVRVAAMDCIPPEKSGKFRSVISHCQ